MQRHAESVRNATVFTLLILAVAFFGSLPFLLGFYFQSWAVGIGTAIPCIWVIVFLFDSSVYV
jgi:hypothetical protein